MHIIVCIKQVPNPEIPSDKFRIDTEAKRVIPPEGIPPVINPYDERAVELALRLKEKDSGKITILTVGSNFSANVVKHALSMGADDGIIIADPAFEGSDSFGIAYILSKAVKKIGNYDIVFCGRQAADWDEGMVGSILAENLSLPLITLVKDIEFDSDIMKVKRVGIDIFQVFAVPVPAVLTVSQEVGRPRLPSGWGIISAARKQLTVWNAKDIQADLTMVGLGKARKELVELFIPKRGRKCEIIQGETSAQAAIKLAEKLREVGAI